MAWPNVTISTANVDAGTDLPRLARADIKQTIDTLNDIITGAVPLGALGFAVISTNNNQNFGGTYKCAATVVYQTGNVVTTSNAGYTLTLGAGTYLVDFLATGQLSTDGTVTLDPDPVWIPGVSGTSFAPGAGVNAGKFAVFNATDNIFTANVQFNANLVVTDETSGTPIQSIRIYRLA